MKLRKGDPESRVTQLLALDFNGTINSHAHWEPDFGVTDVRAIRMAHERGHVVYILTGNSPAKVARTLRALGIAAKADRLMRRRTWDGGKDGRTVLVSHRKLDGTRLIADDRGLRFTYGQDPQLIIDAYEATLAQVPVI
jgi:hypothetical protein